MNKNHYIMDYETLINCFIGCFMHYKTKEIKTFIIWEKENNYKELLEFFKQNIKDFSYHISYNGIQFDSQITEYLIKNKKTFSFLSGKELAFKIYTFAQYIIELSNNDEFLPYAPFQKSILQLDLFTLNHWNNPAKRSSLKWIAYSLDTENLMEMPHPHDKPILDDQISSIVEYCINDLHETYRIFKASEKQINLRKHLTRVYNIDLMSASEATISKKLFVQSLSKKLGVSEKSLNARKTFRSSIPVKDIIFDYVQFKTKYFNSILDKFKSIIIDPKKTKGAVEFLFEYKDCITKFALGGIHGATKSGVYQSNDDFIIVTCDVKSYYPNLCIQNKLSPGHIPQKVFNEQYSWFYDERGKYSKSNPLNYVYKIILNSTYGLSNEINSPFYDPKLTMSITINGQLLLFQLYEMIILAIPDAHPLMQNTDGLEFKIRKSDLNTYYETCAKWENITRLTLEYDIYDKMFISDVNSYLAVFQPKEITHDEYIKYLKVYPYNIFTKQHDKYYMSYVKQKGRLQFLDLELHKNKSYLIIRKAVYNFLIFNILPEKTIKDSRNIFDFCAGHKTKGDYDIWDFKVEDRVFIKSKTQKIIRFYNSISGSKLIKINRENKKQIKLEAGPYYQKLYLKHKNINWNEYEINYRFYINKAYEEINRIIKLTPETIKLF